MRLVNLSLNKDILVCEKDMLYKLEMGKAYKWNYKSV